MKKDKPVKVSRSVRIAAVCMKVASFVFGVVCVVLTVVSRSHFAKSWTRPFETLQYKPMASDPAYQASFLFFGLAVLCILVPVALYLFGKLNLEALMKPYVLSVAVFLPLGFLFVIWVVIPFLSLLIRGLIRLIAEGVLFH